MFIIIQLGYNVMYYPYNPIHNIALTNEIIYDNNYICIVFTCVMQYNYICKVVKFMNDIYINK